MSDEKKYMPILDVIDVLLRKASEIPDAGEAMKFAQAALNAAHVAVALKASGQSSVRSSTIEVE